MIQKELIRAKLADLIPYEKNPRKIPQAAIDDVKESFRQCGVLDPIEVDENMEILSGHTRRLAAIDAENFGFIFLAFVGIYDMQTIVTIALSTSAIEFIVALCDTPFLYIARAIKNRVEP